MTTTFTLSTERKQALLEQITQEQPWGNLILFLDTIDSLAELEAMRPLFIEHARESDLALLDRYAMFLTKWPAPVLTDELRQQFPLVSERLDTTWKIRVFIRAVTARNVTAETMAQVFEELLHRHEVLKEDFLWYPNYRDGDFGTALRIVYHTELPYWTLTKLMFGLDQPKTRGHRIAAKKDLTGLFIDWRPASLRTTANYRT